MGYVQKDRLKDHYQFVSRNSEGLDFPEDLLGSYRAAYGAVQFDPYMNKLEIKKKTIASQMFKFHYKYAKRGKLLPEYVLTFMLKSNQYLPAEEWITPGYNQFLEGDKVALFYKIMWEPLAATVADVRDFFFKVGTVAPFGARPNDHKVDAMDFDTFASLGNLLLEEEGDGPPDVPFLDDGYRFRRAPNASDSEGSMDMDGV